MGKINFMGKIVRSMGIFMTQELKRGTLSANIKGLMKMDIKEEMSWGELLEEKAKKYGERTFLIFDDDEISYAEMNRRSNKMANFFKGLGAQKSEGVALFMDNSPRFLDVFFGLQKIGMYSVPVNTSLKGDSLLYILNHCDARFLIVDEEHIETIQKIKDRLDTIETIILNPRNVPLEQNGNRYRLLTEYTEESPSKPEGSYNKEDICFITYTSGTTGRPKGVVYRYKKSSVKLLSLVAPLLYRKSDILYTAMKLFHGNALFVTVTCGMHVGAKVVLRRRFSASSFWDDIRKYNVTSFNTIGAMVPILMKQPERENDGLNNVRFILSAACPADLWEKFEKRFNTKIYEAYGAVDGGGKVILNLGTAPVGSIGRPPMKTVYRLVDENMEDVPAGQPGELIFERSRSSESSVEYYKDKSSSVEKSDEQWIFTGDSMRADEKGYLYFVGRNTESVRIKGENVSAFEVEQALQKHPAVLEAAVYAVPSELAEDEIMASISLVDGTSLSEKELVEFIMEDLPKYAVPRYIKVVKEFPKTETFRIKKKEIEVLGVVKGTYDRNKEAHVY